MDVKSALLNSYINKKVHEKFSYFNKKYIFSLRKYIGINLYIKNILFILEVSLLKHKDYIMSW